jgi:hypothetical protein
MKRLLPLLFLAFIFTTSTQVNAQNPADWETYFENDTVKIEYTYQNCEYTEQFNNEFLIVKISNLTNNELIIEWKEELWYDDDCINCESGSDEFNKTVTIPENTTIEGDCLTPNALRIFSKFTEYLTDMPGINKITILTDFQLENLKY